ncbi:acyl-homoserine-lactone synthase [Bradyrhizobium sp. 14AA]
MLLIKPDRYGDYVLDLAEMHRLRYRFFKQRLQWGVQISGDMEVDEFDILGPVHLLHRSSDGLIQGCVRVLSTGPTMLRDTFPILLEGQPAPRSEQVWESSCSRRSARCAEGERRTATATYELFAGMAEFGLSIRLTEIVTVTDARMKRTLRPAGWPLRPIGKPRPLGNTMAVAGCLEVSTSALERIRRLLPRDDALGELSRNFYPSP